MRQSDSVSEELDTENVQCALDFENTMNELETQLYYRHLPPKEVALRVMEAACKFYDADWCGLIQVDLDLGLWKPLWWHNECQEDKTTILTNEFESSEFLDRWVKAVRRGTPMVVSDQGKLLSAANGEHWLVHYANRYHLAFMSTVNELLKQLMDFHAYDLLHRDAALALTIAPENTKAYYWLIRSYQKQHMDEMAAGELAAAKQKLPEDEYQKLLNSLE